MRSRPDLAFLLSSPHALVALGFGVGLSRWGPGTLGSLLALPIAWALHPLPFEWQLALWLAFSVAGVPICDRAGRDLGEADHGAIVWDEICGMGLVLLAVPPNIAWWAAAFLTFRAFDIVKPWPICTIDRRVPNGLGAMGDDLAAAACAIVVLILAQAWIGGGVRPW